MSRPGRSFWTAALGAAGLAILASRLALLGQARGQGGAGQWGGDETAPRGAGEGPGAGDPGAGQRAHETAPTLEAAAATATAAALGTPTGEHSAAADAIHLPAPTIWPNVIAVGITLLLFGVVTSYAISAAGVLLLIAGLAGWIGLLRREAGGHE